MSAIRLLPSRECRCLIPTLPENSRSGAAGTYARPRNPGRRRVVENGCCSFVLHLMLGGTYGGPASELASSRCTDEPQN